jgi:hypothetical protein
MSKDKQYDTGFESQELVGIAIAIPVLAGGILFIWVLLKLFRVVFSVL